MVEYNSVKEYLVALRKAMGDADRALIADAAYDAEEHLNEMVFDVMAQEKSLSYENAVKKAISQYGSPREIAREYVKEDKALAHKKKRLKKGIKRVDKEEKPREKVKHKKPEKKEDILKNIFSVYIKGRTWKNMVYLFLMFPLGIFYFTYFVTGLSLSLGLVITVIGIPLLILFLMSFSGLAWFHGRLTELLVGIRMPRRRRKFQKTGKIWDRVKNTLKQPRLYTTILYLFMIFPLGIIYFTVMVTFLATSIALIFSPLMYVLRESLAVQTGMPFPLWIQFLFMILGFVMLTWTLHLVNILAIVQGKMTKALLLRR